MVGQVCFAPGPWQATQTMADIFGAMIKGLRRLIGSWFDPEACGRSFLQGVYFSVDLWSLFI